MSTAFDRRLQSILVPVRLAGPSGSIVLTMALDTGATWTCAPPDALRAIGITPSGTSSSVRMITASGTVSAPRVRVGLIESMERQKRAFAVVAYEIPSAARFDGLLGLDFLRPGRLEIDFDRGLIGLQ